jgi:hypothetical protein
MKKLLVAVAALVIAGSALAQVMPVGQTAAPTEVGKISATVAGAITFGDNDVTVIGARCSYGVIENLLLIGDIGMVDAGDSNLGIGIAAQYSLAMLQLPVDLAVRLGFSSWDVSNLTDTGFINVLVLASKKIEQVDGLAVYGGVGAAIALNSDVPDTFSVLVNAGVTYALPVENLSIFGEVTFASGNDIGLGIGVGATYAF